MNYLDDPVILVGDLDKIPDDGITDDGMVEGLFADAFDKQPESEFLVDVYEFWETKNYITVKQWNAVSNIADGN